MVKPICSLGIRPYEGTRSVEVIGQGTLGFELALHNHPDFTDAVI